jgi:hypothetical protein
MVRTHAPGLLLHPDIALNYLSDAVFEAQFVTVADGLARPRLFGAGYANAPPMSCFPPVRG